MSTNMDILSDDDSFFDDRKTVIKRGNSPKTTEKRYVSDLFNTGSKEKKKQDDWLGLGEDITPKSPAKSTRIPKKISFEDDDNDDLLGNLGLTSKTTTTTTARKTSDEKFGEQGNPTKKMNILDSILGTGKTEEKKPKFDDILKDSKTKPGSEEKKSIVDIFEKSSKPTDSQQKSELTRESRRGGRRGSSSGGILDPLGLFTADSTKTTKIDDPFEKPSVQTTESKSAPHNLPISETTPDWLSGNKANIKQSQSEESVQIKEVAKEERKTEDDNQISSLLTQQKLVQSNIEYQNTAIAVQQQESQLLMSLQLKKYEDRLVEMQMKQQEILTRQEQQFNLLLEKQFAKQQILENNLRLQQERINNYIQMLINQPSLSTGSTTTITEQQTKVEELRESINEDQVKIYENWINTLKQRHHEEIFLLEESYKKQISLLEDNLTNVENRLKADLEKMTENFEGKIKNLIKDHELEIEKYKLKISEMETRHGEEIERIRENHNKIIDEIRFEHATLIENLKQNRQTEISVINDSDSYLKKLDTNLTILTNSSATLQELKENVAKDCGVLTKAREESLKAKEHEIALMRESLEKCRMDADQERGQLMALVRTLETRLVEQNQNSREERLALQQATAVLTAKSQALDREIDYNRKSIEYERKQFETIKQQMFGENEKLMLQLTEEKLAVIAEKTRLETTNKLNRNVDLQQKEIEIETALKIAKDSAEMTDRERQKLQRQQIELEKLKRTLFDQEKRLTLKEIELENLQRDAERKIQDGERAIYESRTIEMKYNERIKELQKQISVISMKEKKIAEEKIALSKERLALYTMLRQQKKCGLCTVDSKIDNFDTILPAYFGEIHDRIRLEEITSDNPQDSQ